MYFLVVFRNTLGDVQVPDYSKWSYLEPWKFTMVACWVWFVWFVQIIFMLVMLLNLLIAIISNAYDEVVANSIVTKYNNRCDMNFEASMIKESILTWTFQEV